MANEKTVTITSFELTLNKISASWSWNNKDTDYFKVVWELYYNNTSEWIIDKEDKITYSTSKDSYSYTYNYPTVDNKPSKARLSVTPISKTKKVNDQDTFIFSVEPAVKETDLIREDTPPKPTVEPTYSLDVVDKKYAITITVSVEENEIHDVDYINFRLLEQKDSDSDFIEIDTKEVGKLSPNTTCTFNNLSVGSIYKIQYRGKKGNTYGEWSDPSSAIAPPPNTPIIETIIAEYKKQDETTIQNGITITWVTCTSAKQYEFEFLAVDSNETSKPEDLFDKTDYPKTSQTITEEQTKAGTVTENGTTKCTFTFYNLSDSLLGKKCYVRCRTSTTSSSGGIISSLKGGTTSTWGDIKSFLYGVAPNFPTTWHSQNSIFPGDELKIYFVHNSADNSVLSSYKIKFYFEDGTEEEYEYGKENENSIVKNIYKNNPKKITDNVYIAEIDTSNSKFEDGEKLGYQVCTSGVYSTNNKTAKPEPKYSEYSPKKEVNIYTEPSFTMVLMDNEENPLNDNELSSSENGSVKILESFPLKVRLDLSSMDNQKPVSYNLTILSDSDKSGYETVDNIGNPKMIVKGTTLYSKYFNNNSTSIIENINANDVNLKNGERYIINCMAFLSSGLTVKVSKTFTVNWSSKIPTPFAEVAFYKDTLIAHIRPYTETSDENVMLSVFRREFDGSFVQIGTEIQNGSSDYVIDPHPALNYSRYRIVAKDKLTGAIEYNDTGILSMGEYSIVLQWDEAWSSFSATKGQILSNSPWSGSILKLPYNINITSNPTPDVSMVDYAGRKHPVSYYGTQTGESETWSVDIPKYDMETLYAIRRLSVWMGDVYVREPSGSGYWANVTVSYSRQSQKLVIPVTFNITRVEGGI